MDTKRRQQFMRQYIQPVVPEYIVRHGVLFANNDEAVLCGYDLESSRFSANEVRLRVFAQPLFVPATCLLFAYFRELGPSSYFTVDVSKPDDLLARLITEHVTSVGIDLHKKAATAELFIEHQQELRHRCDPTIFWRDRVLGLVLLGDTCGAIAAVDTLRAEDAVLPRPSGIADLIIEVEGCLRRGELQVAQSRVRGIISDTRKNLRLWE